MLDSSFEDRASRAEMQHCKQETEHGIQQEARVHGLGRAQKIERVRRSCIEKVGVLVTRFKHLVPSTVAHCKRFREPLKLPVRIIIICMSHVQNDGPAPDDPVR